MDAERSVRLVLPEPPSANRWWRNVKGRMVTSREAREYKRMVEFKIFQKRYPGDWDTRMTTPLIGMATFQKPTTLSVSLVWSRSRKAGDLDKRIGILLDALQGLVYESDSQIVAIHAERRDAEDQYSAGVEIVVSPLASPGIPSVKDSP